MNREQLNKHWKVIEAYKNGADIEINVNDKWVGIEYPLFDITTEYRVKPKSYSYESTIIESIKAIRYTGDNVKGVESFLVQFITKDHFYLLPCDTMLYIESKTSNAVDYVMPKEWIVIRDSEPNKLFIYSSKEMTNFKKVQGC